MSAHVRAALEHEQHRRCRCGETNNLRVLDAHGVLSLACGACIARVRNEERDRKQRAADGRRAIRAFRKSQKQAGR